MFRIYENADPTVHELTLFAYSFLNAAMFVSNWVLTATQIVEKMSITGKIAEATAAVGVKF